MKPNAKVKHVALKETVTYQGKDLKKSLFSGPESLLGVEMNICPIGVECHHKGVTFLIPFERCGLITLAPEETTPPEQKKGGR